MTAGGEVLAFAFFGALSLLLSGGALLSSGLGIGEQVVGGIVEEVLGGLAGAVGGALVDLQASILQFFWDAAEPDLQGAWFAGPDAPYTQMVVLAAPLLVAFFLAGVIQGVLRGDTAGMLRMALLRLPASILAMSTTVVVTDALLHVADDMSETLLAGFREDLERVQTVLALVGVNGGPAGLMLTLVFASVGLLAAVVLLIELFVRGALLYLVAAFSPLVYAAAIWEPMRSAVRKLAEVALALIVSKVAIALALGVSGAALVAAWPDTGQPTALVTPEQMALQSDQTTAQTVGVLVGAIVMFAVAAFMPFVLWRLLPMAEGALATQGVRGAPLRGVQMATSAAVMATNNPAAWAIRRRSASGEQEGEGDGRTGGRSGARPSRRAAAEAGRAGGTGGGSGRRAAGAGKAGRGSGTRAAGDGRAAGKGKRSGAGGPQRSGNPAGRRAPQRSPKGDGSATAPSGKASAPTGRAQPNRSRPAKATGADGPARPPGRPGPGGSAPRPAPRSPGDSPSQRPSQRRAGGTQRTTPQLRSNPRPRPARGREEGPA